MPGYADMAEVVCSHHERWDGRGYPDGLRRDAIPLLARIIAVADSYNAMTSDRPYRAALAPEHAIAQLVAGKGSQCEPPLVDAFLRVLARAPEWYRLGCFAVEAEGSRPRADAAGRSGVLAPRAAA